MRVLLSPYPASTPTQQEGVVKLSSQGLDDLKLRGDAPGRRPQPEAAALSVLLSTTPAGENPLASRLPGDARRAAPRGADSGSGILQPPAAPTPPAGPLLPAGAALGRPPLEAGVRHLQRASCLPHRELQLRQLEASVGLNQTSQPRPAHAPQTRRGQAWKTATRGSLGGAPPIWGRTRSWPLGGANLTHSIAGTGFLRPKGHSLSYSMS